MLNVFDDRWHVARRFPRHEPSLRNDENTSMVYGKHRVCIGPLIKYGGDRVRGWTDLQIHMSITLKLFSTFDSILWQIYYLTGFSLFFLERCDASLGTLRWWRKTIFWSDKFRPFRRCWLFCIPRYKLKSAIPCTWIHTYLFPGEVWVK